jgi:hypothetical protein
MKGLLWLLLVSSAIASPFAAPKVTKAKTIKSHSSKVIKNRQAQTGSGTFSITGIQNGISGDGSVPSRLEIRQLQANADQWNMYLLALDQLQTIPDQSNLLSHYQISGIHGQPYVAVWNLLHSTDSTSYKLINVQWDGVQAKAGGENSGYCTHSSILFPTWHRPYLALYEVYSST